MSEHGIDSSFAFYQRVGCKSGTKDEFLLEVRMTVPGIMGLGVPSMGPGGRKGVIPKMNPENMERMDGEGYQYVVPGEGAPITDMMEFERYYMSRKTAHKLKNLIEMGINPLRNESKDQSIPDTLPDNFEASVTPKTEKPKNDKVPSRELVELGEKICKEDKTIPDSFKNLPVTSPSQNAYEPTISVRTKDGNTEHYKIKGMNTETREQILAMVGEGKALTAEQLSDVLSEMANRFEEYTAEMQKYIEDTDIATEEYDIMSDGNTTLKGTRWLFDCDDVEEWLFRLNTVVSNVELKIQEVAPNVLANMPLEDLYANLYEIFHNCRMVGALILAYVQIKKLVDMKSIIIFAMENNYHLDTIKLTHDEVFRYKVYLPSIINQVVPKREEETDDSNSTGD